MTLAFWPTAMTHLSFLNYNQCHGIIYHMIIQTLSKNLGKNDGYALGS